VNCFKSVPRQRNSIQNQTNMIRERTILVKSELGISELVNSLLSYESSRLFRGVVLRLSSYPTPQYSSRTVIDKLVNGVLGLLKWYYDSSRNGRTPNESSRSCVDSCPVNC